MGYWENLPQQCPPAEAQDVAIEVAYRVVYADPPQKDDFASHAKLGKKAPESVDPCAWASCSMCTRIDRMRNFAGLPKVRGKGPTFVAKLSIPAGSGMSLKKGYHIDFWMFDTFDPVAATIEAEAV
jgi:hypothetical protein